MMRDIKFRGKRTDNGEWVFGYFTIVDGGAFIQAHNPMRYPPDDEVVIETVGQYTGLKDKNDVEIYEGDIIIINQERWRKYSVEYWGKDFGSFVLVKDDKYFESFFDYSVLEVIGTIHDKEKHHDISV